MTSLTVDFNRVGRLRAYNADLVVSYDLSSLTDQLVLGCLTPTSQDKFFIATHVPTPESGTERTDIFIITQTTLVMLCVKP